MYYRFGEASGTSAADSSGNSFTGTITGNPTLGATGALVDSSDTCIDFDGTGDYVTRAYSSTLNPSSVSVVAWIKRDTDTGATENIVYSRGSNTGFSLQISTGDRIAMTTGTGATTTTVTGATTTFTTGTWYHIVATNNGTTTNIYVNGVLEISGASTYAVNTTTALFVGSNSTPGAYWNGKLDEVSIHSGTVLTAAQALELYTQGATGYTRELSGWERSWCKVVEPIQFGELRGPQSQTWQVVLRASDPRVYSDVTTTDDETITTYSGTTATPVIVSTAVTVGSGEDYDSVYKSVGSSSRAIIANAGSLDTVRADLTGFTTTARMVVDAGVNNAQRSAYWLMPQNPARKVFYRPLWMYRMNESAGTTIDNYEGTAAYDGTTSGTPTLNQTGPVTDSKSILFDGVNDYISRTYVAAMHPAEFTFECWYSSPSGPTGLLYSCGTASTRGFSVGAGQQTLYLKNLATNEYVGIIQDVIPSGWNHVGVTYKDNLWGFYLNGQQLNTFSGSAYVQPTSEAIFIGSSSAGAGFYGGYISSMAVYSTAFSPQMISDMYNSGSAQSVCNYRAGAFINDVRTWPEVEASSTTFGKSIDGFSTDMTTTYREPRI